MFLWAILVQFTVYFSQKILILSYQAHACFQNVSFYITPTNFDGVSTGFGGNTAMCPFIENTNCNRIESQNFESAAIKVKQFKPKSGHLKTFSTMSKNI
jgi:hypothetical protein